MTRRSDTVEGLEVLDTDEVLSLLFHPRPEAFESSAPADCEVLRIPVAPDVQLGCRLYGGAPDAPLILFFHGNGEIARDYDDIGSLFQQCGVQLLVVDYRGYGISSGRPSVAAMVADAGRVFAEVKLLRKERAWAGPLIVMGRSLGSASAVEIAGNDPVAVDGLVVESGFASLGKLMGRIGLSGRGMRVFEGTDLLNTRGIRRYGGPTLVIHAENDTIIPLKEGLALFEASPAEDKNLLRVPGAGHNDLFVKGLSAYMEAVVTLCRRAVDRRKATLRAGA